MINDAGSSKQLAPHGVLESFLLGSLWNSTKVGVREIGICTNTKLHDWESSHLFGDYGFLPRGLHFKVRPLGTTRRPDQSFYGASEYDIFYIYFSFLDN